MRLIQVVERIYDKFREQEERQEEINRLLRDNQNVVGTAYSFAEYTVSELPSTLTEFQLGYASNALKSGETSGNGTGCPVWYDPSSSQWKTFYDNSVVAS